MAYAFDGVDDYLSQLLTLAGQPLTIAVWVRPDNITDTEGLVSANSTSDSSKLAAIKNAANAQARAGSAAGASNSVSASGSLVAGQWAHLMAVLESDTSRRAWLNGVAGSLSTTARTVGALDRMTIGANSAANGTGSILSWFAGEIAEPAVWNVAMGDVEAAMLATGFCPCLVRPQSLIFYAEAIRGLQNLKGGLLTVNGAPSVVPHPRRYG
ncbi:MAG: LamG-like jellyroll fold domain-containing protein [Panacagrimonas sp.]